MIDQWEPPDVREFRTSWASNPQTGARRMSMLKLFFEYCVANEWITRNPARLVKNPRGRDAAENRAEQKLPFTDDELKRMYDACPKYGRTPKHKWTADDVADFISGEGRNLLYRAEKGWKVTGVDLSEVGIPQTRRTARARGLKIATPVVNLDDFDFGNGNWDLIAERPRS